KPAGPRTAGQRTCFRSCSMHHGTVTGGILSGDHRLPLSDSSPLTTSVRVGVEDSGGTHQVSSRPGPGLNIDDGCNGGQVGRSANIVGISEARGGEKKNPQMECNVRHRDEAIG
ncbi:MAG: hypothetical protein M1305_07445, partial [Candidatus Marsarchaeota archaeon]|nr:hypothetical protein [Candidatus Marsarchaeota archaeon]